MAKLEDTLPIEIAPDVHTTVAHARLIAHKERMQLVENMAVNLRRAERSGRFSKGEVAEYNALKAKGDAGLQQFLENRGLEGEGELAAFKSDMKSNGGFFGWLFNW